MQVAGRGNPQKQNTTIIEFHADNIVSSLQDTLSITIVSGNMPNWVMGRAAHDFLNGKVFYPTKIEELAELTVTFKDFGDIPSRPILEEWFQAVYNASNGLMTPVTALKTDANVVMFGSDGEGERSYLLKGVWPLKAPEVPIDHTSGEQIEMEITFSVDFVVPQFESRSIAVA